MRSNRYILAEWTQLTEDIEIDWQLLTPNWGPRLIQWAQQLPRHLAQPQIVAMPNSRIRLVLEFYDWETEQIFHRLSPRPATPVIT